MAWQTRAFLRMNSVSCRGTPTNSQIDSLFHSRTYPNLSTLHRWGGWPHTSYQLTESKALPDMSVAKVAHPKIIEPLIAV